VDHPLLALLLAAADGHFPPVDGGCTVLPALPGGLECSVAFTGHAVVATDLPQETVLSRQPDGYGGSLAPDFLRWLAGPGGTIGVIDATLVARGTGSGSRLPERSDLADHPRVRFAARLRTDLRVWADERGLVTLARGLAGRRELSIEAASPGHGAGPDLLREALALVPAGEPVFAAVSPGNARSLRALLTAGFRPLGSEVLLQPARWPVH
jgi:hypothetical protein